MLVASMQYMYIRVELEKIAGIRVEVSAEKRHVCCAREAGLRPHRSSGLREGRQRATPGEFCVGTGGATDRGTQQFGAFF